MPKFKTGRRKPKDHEALLFGKYRAPGIPVFPVVDYLPRLSWLKTMLGNDTFGCCVAVMIANFVRLVTFVLTGTALEATLAEVIAIYKTQNPKFDPNSATHGAGSNDDGGMDIQTMLEDFVTVGFTIGGKLVKGIGFVKLDQANLAELRASCSLFGGILLGVNVADAQQSQFPSKPWDYVKGSPIEGGHAILGGGHEDKAKDELRFVCWAAEDTLTDLFITHQLEEAWAVIMPEHLGSKRFIDGMDLATFAADYTAITGRPFPVPTPAPTPTPPAPVPTPSPIVETADTKFAAAAKTWLADKKL